MKINIKNLIHYITFMTLIVGMLFISCVSNKRVMASEAQVDMLQKDSTNTHSQLTEFNVQVQNGKNEKASMQEECEICQLL